MRAKEFIMEVPTSGTTGTTGTTNTAVGTGTPKPAPTPKYGRPQGGRGNPVSKVRNDDGTMTSSDQITGNTTKSGAFGTITTNRTGSEIQRKTPRLGGLQQTTNINPNLSPGNPGREVTSSNYRGNIGGSDVDVTWKGVGSPNQSNITKQKVGFGGVSVSNSPGRDGKPATRDLQMNFGPNQVNMTKTGNGNKQPTTTFKRNGKVVK